MMVITRCGCSSSSGETLAIKGLAGEVEGGTEVSSVQRGGIVVIVGRFVFEGAD